MLIPLNKLLTQMHQLMVNKTKHNSYLYLMKVNLQKQQIQRISVLVVTAVE